ncbi:hypothetical protein PRIPAC_95201 [Pristionchus pacificus]|uniref:Uncharacterized protein n=1 Tax=Pristionchus pacificus TaxID=54126 RepID=A0A2A6CGU4_PRIPA|nr:hypothetical protein PRIPAC_95201 [Pristionchus pacificus]|eukprot:PDM77444.1 hypothetical protein PRIPAC_33174 [Pristionchus pacificus]
MPNLEIRIKTIWFAFTDILFLMCLFLSSKCSRKEKLRVAQRKMERKMIDISLFHRWSNLRVRERTKVQDWVKLAERKKMDWANRHYSMGEVLRMRKGTTPPTSLSQASPASFSADFREHGNGRV